MLRIVNMLVRSSGKKALTFVLSAAALAGLGLTPTAAHAGHDKNRVDFDINIRIGDRDRCEEKRVRVWVPAEYRTVCDKRYVEPVYEDRCERVWIEPVYEERCERVWVEPVYETRRERCWVPEEVEFREVRRYDRHCDRWVYVRERCVVRPGRWEHRERRVCVREGRFDEVRRRVCTREGRFEEVRKRVCVAGGRWVTCDRKELVRAGYWTWRTERVARGDRHDHDRHDHDRRDHARRPIEVVNPHVRF